jgi:hypothetical protein
VSPAADPAWLVISRDRIDLSDICSRCDTGGIRARDAGSLKSSFQDINRK